MTHLLAQQRAAAALHQVQVRVNLRDRRVSRRSRGDKQRLVTHAPRRSRRWRRPAAAPCPAWPAGCPALRCGRRGRGREPQRTSRTRVVRVCAAPSAWFLVAMEVGTATMSFSLPSFISCPMRATANAAVDPVPRPGGRRPASAAARGAGAAALPRTDLHAGLDVLDRLPRRLLLELVLREERAS